MCICVGVRRDLLGVYVYRVSFVSTRIVYFDGPNWSLSVEQLNSLIIYREVPLFSGSIYTTTLLCSERDI